MVTSASIKAAPGMRASASHGCERNPVGSASRIEAMASATFKADSWLLRPMHRKRWCIIALTGLKKLNDNSHETLGYNPVYGQLYRAAVGLQVEQPDQRIRRQLLSAARSLVKPLLEGLCFMTQPSAFSPSALSPRYAL